MKCFDVHGTEVYKGIPVASSPYPHIVLGEGGHKRATWIALGKRDAEAIIKSRRLPCPRRGDSDFTTDPATCSPEHVCEKCGQKYGPWEQGTYGLRRRHPNAGEVDGPACVHDVGIIALRNKETGEPTGKFLIVAPRGNRDNRVLVLWRVSSGYRGSASISAGEGVTLIATDSSWHSGRGALGETAEVLAILKPGQELIAYRSGRRVQETHARLVYGGKEISVTFGDETLFAAISEEVEGEYL